MMRMQEKVWLIAVAVLVSACGGEAKKRDISEEPLRAGGLLEPISIVYNDSAPSLSADGTKLVFVSGRLSTDTEPSFKIFKVDWPKAGAPGAPARLTTDDLGYEREAVISPDGTWTAIKNAAGGRTDIYLQKYTGGSAVRVTDDAASETGLAFSPDSKMLLWVSKGEDDAGKATAVARVVAIGAGAAADMAKAKTASADGVVVDTAFWAGKDGANYRLAISSPSAKVSGRNDVSVYSFATAADAASAEGVVWREGVLLSSKVGPVVVGNKGLFTDRVLPSAQKMVVRGGDFEEESPSSAVAQAEVILGDVGSAATAEMAPAAGFQILATSLGADSTGFVLATQGYRCAPGTALVTGAAVAVQSSGSTELKRLTPRLTQDGKGYEVASEFCDTKRGDDSLGRIDDRLVGMTVNAAATAAEHRVVYVTQHSTAFNNVCVLKVGDQEIYGFDIKADAKKIVALSLNPAPLTNDDRGGEPLCEL